MPDTAIAEKAPWASPPDDPECAYLAMPQGMATFSRPSLYTWQDGQAQPGRALLAAIAERLRQSEPSARWELDGLDEESLRFVAEALGHGEVVVRIDAPGVHVDVQESVFAGLWQVREQRMGHESEAYLETGPLPHCVAHWADELARRQAIEMPATFPAGIMNAPALLAEIFAKSQDYLAGRESMLNLSLLPLSSQDSAMLAETLGLAGLAMVSKGYGDCRVQLTRLPHVWWVQYFNSSGQLILSTLEVTNLPAVAQAAAEDMADSAVRLKEALAGLAS